MGHHSDPPYIPDEYEIRHRAAIMRMMINNQWPQELMDSIFYRDHPTPARVLEMVSRYGHQEAFQRIVEFMI